MPTFVDFTNCPPGYREYGGSDAKKSIEYNGKKYMLKFPEKRDKKNSLQSSVANNVLSEYIGSHVFQALRIPVHETVLGLYDGEIVVACKDFATTRTKLHEFTWFMKSMYRKDEIGRMPAYDQIYEVMGTHPLLEGKTHFALQRYWDTFVVDALIGNFDRHKGNWGYLVNEQNKTVALAPVYDCGSCLYPGLSEKGMKTVLDSQSEIDMRLFEFPKAALLKDRNFKRENKIKYHEMLLSDTDSYCINSLLKIYPRIKIEEIYKIIDELDFLSPIRANFYKTMLSQRYEKILTPAYEKHLAKVQKLHQDAFENYNNIPIVESIAKNPITQPKTLYALAKHPNRSIRIAVAQNLNSDLRILKLLYSDPNVAGYVELHPNFQKEMKNTLKM